MGKIYNGGMAFGLRFTTKMAVDEIVFWVKIYKKLVGFRETELMRLSKTTKGVLT